MMTLDRPVLPASPSPKNTTMNKWVTETRDKAEHLLSTTGIIRNPEIRLEQQLAERFNEAYFNLAVSEPGLHQII